MPSSDLSVLLTSGSEELHVEYKAWMDTSQSEAKAKLARHFAALANHGGGFLIFGVDDATKQPQGVTEFPLSMFGEDTFSSIIKKYLDPSFQVRVEKVELDGVLYPVVIVPSHGSRPIIAIADGPHVQRSQRTGVRQGALYVRSVGPESIAIKQPDDWTALLERCLSPETGAYHAAILIST